MPVDGPCCDVFVYAPDVAQQLFSTDGTASVLDEVVQDAKFEGGELEFFTVFLRSVAAEVYFKVTKHITIKLLYMIRLTPPKITRQRAASSSALNGFVT